MNSRSSVYVRASWLLVLFVSLCGTSGCVWMAMATTTATTTTTTTTAVEDRQGASSPVPDTLLILREGFSDYFKQAGWNPELGKWYYSRIANANGRNFGVVTGPSYLSSPSGPGSSPSPAFLNPSYANYLLARSIAPVRLLSPTAAAAGGATSAGGAASASALWMQLTVAFQNPILPNLCGRVMVQLRPKVVSSPSSPILEYGIEHCGPDSASAAPKTAIVLSFFPNQKDESITFQTPAPRTGNALPHTYAVSFVLTTPADSTDRTAVAKFFVDGALISTSSVPSAGLAERSSGDAGPRLHSPWTLSKGQMIAYSVALSAESIPEGTFVDSLLVFQSSSADAAAHVSSADAPAALKDIPQFQHHGLRHFSFEEEDRRSMLNAEQYPNLSVHREQVMESLRHYRIFDGPIAEWVRTHPLVSATAAAAVVALLLLLEVRHVRRRLFAIRQRKGAVDRSKKLR